MMDNMAKEKNSSKEWGKIYRSQQQNDLKKAEEGVKELYKKNGAGAFSEEEHNKFKYLEVLHIVLLANEEQAWRLKNIAVWIVKGDNNTKFFHRFASHRRNVNTIAKIWNDQV